MSKNQEVVKVTGSSVDCTRIRNFDQALRRFSRNIKDSGILIEMRERQTHTKKGEKKREAKKKAIRRCKRNVAFEKAERNRLY